MTNLPSYVKNFKHRSFLLTLYAAALRLNEATQMTISGCDRPRLVDFVSDLFERTIEWTAGSSAPAT